MIRISWVAILISIVSCSAKKEVPHDFRTGNFLQQKISENFHLHIERHDTIQAEINMNTKVVSLFRIDWINSNQYTLTALKEDSITVDQTQPVVEVEITKGNERGYFFTAKIEGTDFTLNDFLPKVDSFPCLYEIEGIPAPTFLHDSIALDRYVLFDEISIGIPEIALIIPDTAGLIERLGYVYFSTQEEEVDITVNKRDKMPLEGIKNVQPQLHMDLYQAEIIESKIIEVDGVKIYIIDAIGYWNGKGERIGIFRYYLNSDNYSFNLLMKYPFTDVESSKKLKQKMVNTIRVLTKQQA